MYSLHVLCFIGCFVVAICRPPLNENKSQEELDYVAERDSSADDTLEDTRFKDDETPGQDIEQSRRLLDLNKNTYLQKNLAEDDAARNNLDIPDYKSVRNRGVRNDKLDGALNSNDEFTSYDKHRQSNRYIENAENDQIESASLTSHDVNNYRNSRKHNYMFDSPLNQRTVGMKNSRNDDGVSLFDISHDQLNYLDKSDYNSNAPPESNRRTSYTKQYNQMQYGKAMLDAKYPYFNRDRRQTKKYIQENVDNVSNKETANSGGSENENEEIAIRRHIKKLSENELEELLDSLTEEKRALLKRIIADDADMSENIKDNINKRDITKKAGAVEDNGYIEGSQSESSKMQGASSLDFTTDFPTTQNSESPETTKQATPGESTVLSNSKTPQEDNNLVNKVELKSKEAEDHVDINVDSSKNEAELKEQVEKNKEETYLKDISLVDPNILENDYAKQDDEEFCSQDDLAQISDQDIHSYDSMKLYKRDVDSQSTLDSKFKSLEESFPNSNAYDESAPYSGPLIRVKRNNNEGAIKKRAAAILPDANIEFVSYKAEGEDEDTEEGNEFDDNSFYDPTPNLVSNENKDIGTNSQQSIRDDVRCAWNTGDHIKTPVSRTNSETSLGSDTDNVLSGAEGVDENLMFNSAMRSRRKTEDNMPTNIDGNNLVQSASKTVEDEATVGTNSSNLKGPNYQESDAFGGLPHSYDGELGRYKRIRRVKQSHDSEETTLNT